MVNAGCTFELFPFQEQAVVKLLDFVTDPASKQTITVKSPTGSGKTIILIDFIDEYLTRVSNNTAFVWLCPGKGDLEEQSREKMQQCAPHRPTQSLLDALSVGFEPGATTFINWELVTGRKNTAIRPGERKNLYDQIDAARREDIDFIIIIDEEHSHNTVKAQTVIDAFSAKHIIRVSATAKQNKRFEFLEIDETDVIDAGLITKALYVNEGIEEDQEVDNDYDYLLNLADDKRKAIADRYHELGKNIRPLVLIQFPSARHDTIQAVEQKLEELGYTYDNGMVSKWMSEDKKDLPDNLAENDGQPVFLLMKQAISTGWDCPRAKILVKLRENMSETFTIQTIGRIRRMPEAKHYDDDLLDYCYVYTFDETYKAGLLSDMDKAYEIRRLFLKKKCQKFTLEKETRDLDYNSLGEREVLEKIYEHYNQKYGLTKDKTENQSLLEEAGYQFGAEIISEVLQGKFVHTEKVAESETHRTVRKRVNTHEDGMQLLHCVDAIKTAIGITNASTKAILERLFRKSAKGKYKLLNLETEEFYAFVINNYRQLRTDFKEVTAEMEEQLNFALSPKKSTFHIPEQDFYRYDPGVKDETEYDSNAYKDYTSGYATTVVRSLCENLFEQRCEERSDIDWVYKNGDSGQQYFSIVYLDGLQKQSHFYADYIVKKKDGSTWVIETKGGESHGEDKNIDEQIGNKFNALQQYANREKVQWGFVRYDDNRLYINNTEFNEDIKDDNWKPLDDIF